MDKIWRLPVAVHVCGRAMSMSGLGGNSNALKVKTVDGCHKPVKMPGARGEVRFPEPK